MTITDQEKVTLRQLLAKATSAGPDFGYEQMEVLITIGAGMFWSPELAARAHQLAEDVDEEFALANKPALLIKTGTVQELGLENEVNLCDSCQHVIPTCKGDNLIYGTSKGNDNVAACNIRLTFPSAHAINKLMLGYPRSSGAHDHARGVSAPSNPV